MMRLIDADALKSNFKMFAHLCSKDNKGEAETINNVFSNIIDACDTIFVVNNSDRIGKWIDTAGTEAFPLDAQCSLCEGDAPRDLLFALKTPYCPHCGAKMDLEG